MYDPLTLFCCGDSYNTSRAVTGHFSNPDTVVNFLVTTTYAAMLMAIACMSHGGAES